MQTKNNNEILLKLTNILTTLLFSFSYFLYYLSLEKCNSGIDVCGSRIKWIFKKVFQLSASCIISSILFLLIFFNIISKLHIFHFILFFIYFYKKSHGYSFEDHGAFNLIAFFLVFFFIIVSGLLIKGLLSLFIFNV